jgi:GAF domain-containing protein
MSRDIAHRVEAGSELARLVEEQAALRRVATLVANGVEPGSLFDALAGEVEALFGADISAVVRFEGDGTVTVMGVHGGPHSTGTRAHLDPDYVVAAVYRTGQSASFDSGDCTRESPAIARDWGVRSALATPVIVEGQLWGAITIASLEHALVAGTERRLADFSELFATAIANAESRRTLAQLADEQAALRRVATLVAQEDLPENVFAMVAEETGRLLGGVECTLLRNERDGAATNVGTWGDKISAVFPLNARFFPDGDGVAATVLRTGRPHRIDDYSAVADQLARSARDRGTESSVGCPIMVLGAIWGAILVGTTGAEPFPPETETRLTQFAELIATAVANAQSRETVAELAEEQAALRRIAVLVAQDVSASKIFSAVSDEVARMFDSAAGVMRFEDGSAVVFAGVANIDIPIGERWEFQEGMPSAEVYRTGRPARSEEVAPSSLGGDIGEASRRNGTRSIVGSPILVEGRLWGTIVVSSSKDLLRPDTEERLERFAELIATAIANAETSQARAQLAEEQGALRRVATLVAEGVDAQHVFDAVCREACQLCDAMTVTLSHYTPDGVNMTIAGWSANDSHLPIGTRLPIEPDTVGDAIVRTRSPARVDSWEGRSSELAKLQRARGVRSSLGAPIAVGGQLWGALIAGTDREEPLSPGTEFRLARFTELVATAISNTATRSELIASRARIVAAGDEARQRIERNLHDGTQQRLIALGLDLQRVRALIPEDQHDARLGLERAGDDLQSVLEDLRELSRGLHPPLLARRGLRSALRGLARDSPIPVELEINLSQRPPAPLEAAVYYVVSEALTNALKHSQASIVSITIESGHAREPFGVGLDGRGRVHLHATIADDGVGGADPSAGSGLTGLADRVEALGGRFALDTPSGRGTRISIELPLEIR